MQKVVEKMHHAQVTDYDSFADGGNGKFSPSAQKTISDIRMEKSTSLDRLNKVSFAVFLVLGFIRVFFTKCLPNFRLFLLNHYILMYRKNEVSV